MVNYKWEVLEYGENNVAFKEKVNGRYVIVSVPYELLEYIVDLQIKNKVVK